MKIAIMGFGTVGSGVGEILVSQKEEMTKKAGEPIEVKYILDLRDFPDSPFKCFTKNFEDILNDDEVGLVVEAMGGTVPAYDFTKRLLTKGKHVITSNKELVAKHGTELLTIAREKSINYLFEASVGGGIPIIRPLISSLTGSGINSVVGILNGTTNYILTQMIDKGKTFEEALSEAQEKGYSEKDPTNDIEGFDTCRKTAILASLAFGKAIDSEKIPTEGITKVTLEDTMYAEKFSCSVKLIGECRKAENGVFARVCPAFVPYSNLISNVNGVFNGIMVDGDEVGSVMFYGRGAGKLPTASAVVSDVVDAVKHKETNIRILWTDAPEGYLLDGKDCKYKFYLRLKGDMNGFENAVSIADGEFAIITDKITEAEIEEIAKGHEIIGKMRVIG
ncbi:MAG: homoserine dehydrogenase [Clostridia bacterium]|nr:homoserine dehydrogenase [Clostridia bacterium]